MHARSASDRHMAEVSTGNQEGAVEADLRTTWVAKHHRHRTAHERVGNFGPGRPAADRQVRRRMG